MCHAEEECFAVLEKKYAMIHERGMKPLIVTQFGFDPDAFLQWLSYPTHR